MRIAVLALLTVVASGCYRYGSVSPSELSTPDIVRLELTDAGTVNVTQALGTSVEYVEGTVAQSGASGITLNVSAVRRRGETLYREWPGDPVTFPAADLRSVLRKTQDRGRTAAMVVGAGSLAIATVVIVAKSTGLFSGGSGNKPPPNVRPR